MMNSTFTAMNSTIQLVDIQEDTQIEIKQMIDDFEKLASRFILNNHLDIINKSPLDIPILLDDTIANLLEKSLILSRKTDYYVHPFLGDVMKEIGYTHSFQKDGEPVFEESAQKFIEEPIEMLSKNFLVKKKDFTFDFGGFGKGYIVDQAKSLLLEKNSNHALINAGGDLTVIGTYEVGIEHPKLKGKDMMKLSITDCALATSSKMYRKWKKNDKSMHHIVNGLTGRPAFNGVLQASVIAKTAIEAETASKLFCILPFNQAKTMLAKKFPRIAFVVYFDHDTFVIGGNQTLYSKLEVAQ